MTKQVSKENMPRKDIDQNDFVKKVKGFIIEDYCQDDNSTPLDAVVSEISKKLSSERHDVVNAIRALEQSGDIRIVERDAFASIIRYSMSPHSNWFWASYIITLFSLGLIFVTSGFALYLRYFFGTLLILFLPGYSIVQLLFARQEERNDRHGSYLVKLIALSVGLSLVIVPSLALILNYTSLGITLFPLALVLTVITIGCLVGALVRKYNQYSLGLGIS